MAEGDLSAISTAAVRAKRRSGHVGAKRTRPQSGTAAPSCGRDWSEVEVQRPQIENGDVRPAW